MTIAEFIKDTSMTAAELARQCRVSEATVSRWVNFEAVPRGQHWARLVEISHGRITATAQFRRRRRARRAA